MAVVLVTGMSGTGKSAALAELARRGYSVIDTDYGGYSDVVPSSNEGGWEQLWREDRIDALLDQHDEGVLFISGCVANQVRFYPRFDAVVLMSAPADVILERVATRESNNFGKSDAERDLIVHNLATVEPLLRARATAEIDTRAPHGEVVDALERIADLLPGRETNAGPEQADSKSHARVHIQNADGRMTPKPTHISPSTVIMLRTN